MRMRLGSKLATVTVLLATALCPSTTLADADVPDANLAASAVASGLVGVADVTCHADDGIGALPAIGALAKPFAERRKLLDRCASGRPRDARIRWTAASGRIVKAEVISEADPSNRCIERVLVGAREPVAGICAATVHVGARAQGTRDKRGK